MDTRYIVKFRGAHVTNIEYNPVYLNLSQNLNDSLVFHEKKEADAFIGVLPDRYCLEDFDVVPVRLVLEEITNTR